MVDNWVHILHQDDFVLPGFYDVLPKGAERSAAAAIFCRYAATNSKGHWLNISEPYRESAGLLKDWHARDHCPAISSMASHCCSKARVRAGWWFFAAIVLCSRLGNVATNCLSIFVLVRALDSRLLSGVSELCHFASET